jgi:ethanolamine utilization microcompartment shell protein EutL
MQDRPNAIELLEAAADFVDREIVTATQGRVQFQSRVVANVMRIVAREIKLEDSFVRSEVNALAALQGEPKPHTHSLDDLHKAAITLNEQLCASIRAGEADSDPRRGEVLTLVRQSVEDKLRIANPRYLEADIAARKD